jgi:hypothetical protein
MDVKHLGVKLLMLCLVPVSVWAARAPSPKKDLAHFQTICLKSSQLCRYIKLDFAGDGSVAEQMIVFVPFASQVEANSWNREATARFKPSATSDSVRVAVYNISTHAWKPLTADKHCPLCVPDVTRFDGKSRRWLRFETVRKSRWQLEYSSWIFKRVIGRKDQNRLFVVVRNHNGPIVCASIRSSGMHYQYSTAKSGSFRILLDSDWVQSARPDYVAISPICSWGNLAHRYMKMQIVAMAGSDQLPTFTGTVHQKVDGAVRYIKTRGIRYDATPDEGGYPHQDVAEVLKAHRTDCKGFTTLLYALLRKSGVESEPVLFNAYGMTPMSFSVPDHWSNHVMLYVPSLDRYIDLTVSLPSHGEFTWRTSAEPYAGDVVLDLVTRRFGVVPSHLSEGGS